MLQQAMCYMSLLLNKWQYFHEGIICMEKSMIDAASGGVLVDKTSKTI